MSSEARYTFQVVEPHAAWQSGFRSFQVSVRESSFARAEQKCRELIPVGTWEVSLLSVYEGIFEED